MVKKRKRQFFSARPDSCSDVPFNKFLFIFGGKDFNYFVQQTKKSTKQKERILVCLVW